MLNSQINSIIFCEILSMAFLYCRNWCCFMFCHLKQINSRIKKYENMNNHNIKCSRHMANAIVMAFIFIFLLFWQYACETTDNDNSLSYFECKHTEQMWRAWDLWIIIAQEFTSIKRIFACATTRISWQRGRNSQVFFFHSRILSHEWRFFFHCFFTDCCFTTAIICFSLQPHSCKRTTDDKNKNRKSWSQKCYLWGNKANILCVRV